MATSRTRATWQSCKIHSRTHSYFERNHQDWNLLGFYIEFYDGASTSNKEINDLHHTLKLIQQPCEKRCFTTNKKAKARLMEEERGPVSQTSHTPLLTPCYHKQYCFRRSKSNKMPPLEQDVRRTPPDCACRVPITPSEQDVRRTPPDCACRVPITPSEQDVRRTPPDCACRVPTTPSEQDVRRTPPDCACRVYLVYFLAIDFPR